MSRSKINVEILGGFQPSEACPLNSCGNVGAAHGPVSIMRDKAVSTTSALIKPTAEREITPYKWVYPDDER